MADLQRIHDLTDGIPFMTLRKAMIIFDLVRDLRPTRVLEIGTLHGVSACYFGEMVRNYNGRVITVDLVKNYTPSAEDLVQRCELTNVSIVKHASGASGWFLDHFKKKRPPFDLIYLDGGHEWTLTAAHILMCLGALRHRGWLIMDDLDTPKWQAVQDCWDYLIPSTKNQGYFSQHRLGFVEK